MNDEAGPRNEPMGTRRPLVLAGLAVTIVAGLVLSGCGASDAMTSRQIVQQAAPPSFLTLVKVDYDKAPKLRQKYGVTLQHTFVQVGDNGNVLKKWVGTYDDNSVAWVKAQAV